MRVIPNLGLEFEELCIEYSAHSPSGQDMITLVRKFMSEHDHFDNGVSNGEYSHSWDVLLKEHMNQMTVQMVGMVIYLLTTYWAYGARLYENLPPLEKILLRDTVQEISDEIERRSAVSGNEVDVQN